MTKTAILSPCCQYRYVLTRQWNDSEPVTWIMLNPSTADADKDDPTIRRCIGFAKAWGHGGIHVVNLFAFRATFTKSLKAALRTTAISAQPRAQKSSPLGAPTVHTAVVRMWCRCFSCYAASNFYAYE